MNINKLIDHTLLKADATHDQIKRLCQEARLYDFASVCVNSYWVSYCSELLSGSDVNVCCVIGFPLGASSTNVKAFAASNAIKDGAEEIDMVMNIGAFLSCDYETVLNDIKAVVNAANGHCVKVILETCLLDNAQIVKACQLCVEAEATFVKTSTGFNSAGANPAVVKLMKDTVKDKCLVKAAGGVRSRLDLDLMVSAGADRIGTSSGVAIMNEPKHDVNL